LGDNSNDNNNNNIEALEALGLESGENFLKSYLERFYAAFGVPQESLWIWYRDTKNIDVAAAATFYEVLRSFRRRLFHTPDGYLGLGPPELLPGDLVCVLCGCSIPLLLRRVDSHYTLVGHCFVLGLMDGEAAQRVKEARAEIQCFEIH
jgi:hypothetical protein